MLKHKEKNQFIMVSKIDLQQYNTTVLSSNGGFDNFCSDLKKAITRSFGRAKSERMIKSVDHFIELKNTESFLFLPYAFDRMYTDNNTYKNNLDTNYLEENISNYQIILEFVKTIRDTRANGEFDADKKSIETRYSMRSSNNFSYQDSFRKIPHTLYEKLNFGELFKNINFSCIQETVKLFKDNKLENFQQTVDTLRQGVLIFNTNKNGWYAGNKHVFVATPAEAALFPNDDLANKKMKVLGIENYVITPITFDIHPQKMVVRGNGKEFGKIEALIADAKRKYITGSLVTEAKEEKQTSKPKLL